MGRGGEQSRYSGSASRRRLSSNGVPGLAVKPKPTAQVEKTTRRASIRGLMVLLWWYLLSVRG